MTWTRLSDNFTDRPELLTVSRSARLLHVEALVWCNRQLTDGALPLAALRRVTDAEDALADICELVNAGLWTETRTGWQIDWADQETASVVRERQRYQAEKQKAYRDRQARHRRDDHSKCDPRHCRKAVTGNGTGNETRVVTDSRPVPSRPGPKEPGRRRGRSKQQLCDEGAIIVSDGTCCATCAEKTASATASERPSVAAGRSDAMNESAAAS